jgi:hypothetical protein
VLKIVRQLNRKQQLVGICPSLVTQTPEPIALAARWPLPGDMQTRRAATLCRGISA